MAAHLLDRGADPNAADAPWPTGRRRNDVISVPAAPGLRTCATSRDTGRSTVHSYSNSGFVAPKASMAVPVMAVP